MKPIFPLSNVRCYVVSSCDVFPQFEEKVTYAVSNTLDYCTVEQIMHIHEAQGCKNFFCPDINVEGRNKLITNFYYEPIPNEIGPDFGNPVMDVWAGEVMQKLLSIKKL